MTKPIVLIAKLRNQARYTGPLQQIEDNIFYCLDRYIKNEGKDKYDFRYYKTSFDGRKPSTDVDVAKGVDAIVVVSVAEFTWHIPNFRHQYDQKKGDDTVLAFAKNLDGTNFVLISHEQADTLELFRDYTFKDVKFKSMSQIHQEEMGNEFMHMRYDFITDSREHTLFAGEKDIDFAYWGCSKTKTVGGVKSGDERQKILTEIWRQAKPDLKTYFQGKFDKIKKDAKWTNDFTKIIPILDRSRATLCFQWPGKEHLPTTRYPEALACGIVPLVWGKFDRDGIIYNHAPWQEVNSVDEVMDKILQLKTKSEYDKRYFEALVGFHTRMNAMTRDDIYKSFTQVLESKLPRTEV